jgi:predicted transcriptional regulator
MSNKKTNQELEKKIKDLKQTLETENFENINDTQKASLKEIAQKEARHLLNLNDNITRKLTTIHSDRDM